jgi:hypothetical protein
MENSNDTLQVQVGTLVAELVRVVTESKLDTQASVAALDVAKALVKQMEQPGAAPLGAIQFVSGSTAEGSHMIQSEPQERSGLLH